MTESGRYGGDGVQRFPRSVERLPREWHDDRVQLLGEGNAAQKRPEAALGVGDSRWSGGTATAVGSRPDRSGARGGHQVSERETASARAPAIEAGWVGAVSVSRGWSSTSASPITAVRQRRGDLAGECRWVRGQRQRGAQARRTRSLLPSRRQRRAGAASFEVSAAVTLRMRSACGGAVDPHEVRSPRRQWRQISSGVVNRHGSLAVPRRDRTQDGLEARGGRAPLTRRQSRSCACRGHSKAARARRSRRRLPPAAGRPARRKRQWARLDDDRDIPGVTRSARLGPESG